MLFADELRRHSSLRPSLLELPTNLINRNNGCAIQHHTVRKVNHQLAHCDADRIGLIVDGMAGALALEKRQGHILYLLGHSPCLDARTIYVPIFGLTSGDD